PSSDRSPPPAGATPTAPPAPPPQTPPPSPHSPPPSAASRSAAAGPCRRRRGARSASCPPWSSPSPQPVFALEDAALDGAQRLELLAQRVLALVALLVRALAVALAALPVLREPVVLARGALELARKPLPLRHLRGEERREAAHARVGPVRDRLEELRGARVVAQRRGQEREQRGEPQPVERRLGFDETLLGARERRLLLACRRTRGRKDLAHHR